MVPEVESCYRRLADTHDAFYVRMALLDKAGAGQFASYNLRHVPTLQNFVNAQEIVYACRRAKSHLKKQYKPLGIDFDAVERQQRSARPTDHAYNLMLLAQQEGLLPIPLDDSDGEDGYSTALDGE
jgi:hypothetical protein